MNPKQNMAYVQKLWDESVLPTLMDYIKIPNKSPQFDRQWRQHGHMDKAVALIANWCKTHAIKNMTVDIVQAGERTPVIMIDIPGANNDTILLYGHLDKQPEMTGWEPGLDPWTPVLRGDRLYGRGGADDGYAAFASLGAIKSLHEQSIPHARCVILIEASEESGSLDLPFYIDLLQDNIGQPSLIICLDSSCGNYDQLWATTSLRGLAGGVLKISTLKEGVHSGTGSGVAPSCFRILRQLLNRIEDEQTGDVLIKELHVDIPSLRQQQAEKTAAVLGNNLIKDLPFLNKVLPEENRNAELLLRRTWKPALSVTGCEGIPAIENAGNVTLPSISVKLSMRLPPTTDPVKAEELLKEILEKNPPYGAHVSFTIDAVGPGWNAPLEQPWLAQAINRASQDYFGKDAMAIGDGGSIPFMGMLGKKFPQAQFLITGVLGPEANAHGPNEFLHVPTGKKLTACVAQVIADHFTRVID